MGTSPRARHVRTRSGLTSVMCALPWMLSVMRPAALPVNVRGSWPRSARAIANRAEDTSSPMLSRASRSTGSGRVETSAARSQSSSVVSPMADTTATTRYPFARVLAIRSAARRIPAASARDEPPNFCTMTLPGGIARSVSARSLIVEQLLPCGYPFLLPEIYFDSCKRCTGPFEPFCPVRMLKWLIPRRPAPRSQSLRLQREYRVPSADPRG